MEQTGRLGASLCPKLWTWLNCHSFNYFYLLCPKPPEALTNSPEPAFYGWCVECHSHHIPNNPDQRQFQYDTQCPKSRGFTLPIMIIGDAGACVGSRMKGHSRRGGKKMCKEHMKHTTVGITSEYRTSKTCVFCFQQVKQAQSRRVIDGKIKTVKVNGTVECLNPECVSFCSGYTMKGRDTHAAVAIAVSGIAKLLDPKRAALATFSLSYRPTKTPNIPKSNVTSITLDNLNHHAPNIDADATGAPSAVISDWCKY